MSRHAQIFESMTIMCAETGYRYVTGCVPELGMKSVYPLAADILYFLHAMKCHRIMKQ